MKRTIGVAFLLLFFSAVALSQENVFNVGDKVVNVGLGIGNIGYTGSGWKTTIPPLSASFEMGIKDGVLEKGVIGVGGYLGLAGYKWTYSGFGTEYGWKYTNFILGARGTFHYPLIDKFDTYTGLLIGYEVVSVTEFGVNTGWGGSANGSGIIWSWYAGGRYYFTEKLGAMVELGYGITYLNLGVCLKL